MTDAERQLLEFLGRWRTLTAAEGRAIQTADWLSLDRLQGEKSRLQPQIAAANEFLRIELSKLGPMGDGIQQKFRQMAAELVAMEDENNSALSTQQRVVRRQQGELVQSSRTLRQVRAAYAPGGQAGWLSYS
jgi:hypothetical protein